MRKIIMTITLLGVLILGVANKGYAYDHYYIVTGAPNVEQHYVYEPPADRNTSVNFVDPSDYKHKRHYYTVPVGVNEYYDDNDDHHLFKLEIF